MDDELLDVLDEEGRPRGVKPRSDVHRDGDWHAVFHLWVVGPDGVLLQRRAPTKAAWPGRLDATAAGHLTAGEAVADGVREAEEELGVRFAFAALRPLGVHRVDEPLDTPAGGRNRELQHVFVVGDDRPLDAWTGFDRQELAELVAVAVEDFAALTRGRRGVAARAFDGRTVRSVRLDAGELVPAPYLSELSAALAEQQL